jgi:S-DNA-T family DNA segregation ATPase FtsK/SpoIIIE
MKPARTTGRRLARSLWRTWAWLVLRPLLAVPLVLLVAGFLELGARGFWIALSLVMLYAGAWLGLSPSSFDRLVLQRVRGWWRWVSHYRRAWYPALEGCGLARITPDRKVFVPKVRQVTSTRWVDTLHVRLLHGHTPEDLAKQPEGLRHAFGALRCAVVEDRPGRVRVVMFVRDPLAQVVPAIPVEDIAAVPNLDAVPVGRTEFGQVCTLKLAGTHHIVAAATGAGKSTLTWNVVRALGPGIATGCVRVTGLDPKGGMELYPGRSATCVRRRAAAAARRPLRAGTGRTGVQQRGRRPT